RERPPFLGCYAVRAPSHIALRQEGRNEYVAARGVASDRARGSKPFRIAAAFVAFRSSRICEGVAVALLGIVAISYSLSAELSLWASMRSDKIAVRAAESNVAISARDHYQRAKLELDGLTSRRPALELQSLIDGVLMDADWCVGVTSDFIKQPSARWGSADVAV